MSLRREMLNDAADLVDGDRNAQYGDPNQDFQRTAALWGAYLSGVAERKLAGYAETEWYAQDVIDFVQELIDTHDVGWMQLLLKASRSTVSPGKRDHYVDAAGYAACALHCVASDETVEVF